MSELLQKFLFKRNLFVLIFLFMGHVSIFAQSDQLTKIDSKYFKRLYQLNDSLYRSEQPKKKAFKELEEIGVKTIINFRRAKDNTKRASGTSLKLERLPLKASELTEVELTLALQLIKEAQKPVLIHCWHGSDRTGAVAAASRIVFENWSKDSAIAELRLKGLGHHEKRFPNVVELLMELNAEKIRKELGL